VDLRKILRANMRLLVVDKKTSSSYKSTIQEINPDNIAVSIPMGDMQSRLPKDSSMLKFLVYADDAVITFTGSVVGSKVEDKNIPLYLVAWPQSFERYQRREYFRQPCVLDAHYWVLPPAGREMQFFDPDDLFSLGEPYKATVVDISGGGLRLASKAKHEEDDLLALCLHLQSRKGKKDLWVQGRVIRCFSPVLERQRIYQYAVSYCGIQEKTKEEIIRFIFTLMRGKLK